MTDQARAVELCAFARLQYRKYSVRTRPLSYEGAPVSLFEASISQKYGPDGDWDPIWAKRLSFHAHLYLSMAEQHLGGLEVLLEHGSPGIALGPAARSVAEASGRLLWLLDPRLSIDGSGARKRVARLFLDDEENARIYKSISHELAHPGRAAAADNARRARLAISRPGVFFPSEVSVSDKGLVTLCRQVLPGPSGLVRLAGQVFGDSKAETNGVYRYLSSMTHPTVFAFIETLANVADLPDDYEVIPYRLDWEFALKLASNSVRAFYNAWKVWITWTATGMEEALLVHEAHRATFGSRTD